MRMRRTALALHTGALVVFVLGWCFANWPATIPDWTSFAHTEPRWTHSIELLFVAPDTTALEAHAPTPLRIAIAAQLRDTLARGSAFSSCKHSWHVRSAVAIQQALLLPPSPLGFQLGPVADPHQRRRWLRATFILQRDAPSLLDLNATEAMSTGLAAALLSELAQLSCRVARDPFVWRPPRQVSLVLLQRHSTPRTAVAARIAAAMRSSRSERLSTLRHQVQAFLERCWPVTPPAVSAQVVHATRHRQRSRASISTNLSAAVPRAVPAAAIATHPADIVDLTEVEATDLLAACELGSRRCGLALTLSPEPPLRVLFYAHAPHEAPARLLEHSGSALPEGAGFIVSPSGALLPWRDMEGAGAGSRPSATVESEASHRLNGTSGASLGSPRARWSPSEDDVLYAATRAQLRTLMGLPATAAHPAASAEAGIGVLEREALHLACAHAQLQQFESDLHTLGTASRLSQPQHAAVTTYATTAAIHARNSRRLLSRGWYAAACEQATQASMHARAAARYPLLHMASTHALDDLWQTVWTPLFLPIAVTVGAAVVRERRGGGATNHQSN